MLVVLVVCAVKCVVGRSLVALWLLYVLSGPYTMEQMGRFIIDAAPRMGTAS